MVRLPASAQVRVVLQDSLKKVLPTAADDTAKVNLLIKLGRTYVQTDMETFVQYIRSAYTLAEQLKYIKGMATALVNIAVYHRSKADYSTSMNEFLQSVKIFESLHDVAATSDTYLQLAQLNKDMSGFNLTEAYIDQGIAYCKTSLSLYQGLRDTAGMVDALNMSGIIYRDKSKIYGRTNYYDSALQAYTTAIGFIERSGKGKDLIGKLYNNISQYYIEYKKDYHTALDYLFKAVDYNKGNNNVSSLSFNYGNIAYAYVKLKEPVQSLVYSRKMLEAAQELNRPERIQNAWRQIHESFKANKQFDSALKYYVLEDELGDSLTNLEKSRQVMDLQTKYESGKKELEIQRLEIVSGNKNKQIAILGVALLLFVGLAGFMIWAYRRIRKQRQQIAIQSKGLEVMMKELHHRVKNNLQIVSSLLSLQTYKVQDEGTISVLKESQQRVQAMSLIHQRLYKKDNLTTVNMKEYLTDLAESLVSSYGYDKDSFDLEVIVEKEMLDIDKALPIGLIINEMITNALKYAYCKVARPFLQIQLTEDRDNNIIFLVKDNGIGINESEWLQKGNSFGKQLITALCKQLRARQSFLIDKGTQFTITIPKQAA